MIKSTTPQEEVKEEVVETPVVNDVVDINLSVAQRKRYRINGDNNLILELNPSDMGIVTRLSELYPKLQALSDKVATLGADEEEASDDPEEFRQQLDKFGSQLKEIDKDMRDYIDKLFDANVSETCAPSGNMFDIVGGQFRYDHIIETIAQLCNQTISDEARALRARLAQKTEKYTSQDHKRKSTKRSK